MTLLDFCWWFAFLVIAIVLQRMLPGMDVLIVGILVALQEGSVKKICCVTILCIVLQEGMGTLEFGASLLWYSLTILLYFVGYWLLETRTLLFLLLLTACLGAAHFGVVLIMDRLQYIPADSSALLDESILQALLIPFAWKFAALTRRSFYADTP